MSDQPLVSVIIPTYNGAPWIRESVASALAQTEQDIEVIVCDDASDDGTLDQLRDIADSRLRLISNLDNLGIPANWNRALELAAGRYVKPLMQDDLLDPGCVARLVRAIEADGAVTLAFCRRRVLVPADDVVLVRWARVNANPPARIHRLAAIMSAPHLYRACRRLSFRHNVIGEPTVVLFPAQLAREIGGFDGRMRQLVDFEMWLRLAARGRVAFVDAELAAFRAHRDSATWGNTRIRWIVSERWALLRGLWSDPVSRPLMRYPDWPMAMAWAVGSGISRSVKSRRRRRRDAERRP